MSPSNERSAEWLRGAVESHINTCNLITSITSAAKSHPARQGLMAASNELHNQLDRYRTLLAAAEAREGGEKLGKKNADYWRGAVELLRQYKRDSVELTHLINECLGEYEKAKPREATPPTAAEVIEAAEKALKRVVGLDYMGDPDVAIQSFPNLKVTPMQAAEELYELRSVLARWKEANGDGANTR